MYRSNPYQNPYTNGQTIFHTQTSSSTPEAEIIIPDNIQPTSRYPFNVETAGIEKIEIKLENTALDITDSYIISNKPIFIKCVGNRLYIWNAQSYPNNIISTKGTTYIDGYNILDFDNTNIKSAFAYDEKSWPVPKMNPIQNLIFSGNSNTINLNQDFADDISMKFFGENNICVGKNSVKNYNNLNIYITYSTIHFFNIFCNNLKLQIKGNGEIRKLNVNISADINIIGSSCLLLNSPPDIIYKESIIGTGKVIWNHI